MWLFEQSIIKVVVVRQAQQKHRDSGMIYYFENFDNGKFVEWFKKFFDVNNIKLHSQNVLHIYHDISKGKMFQDFEKS